MSQYSKAWFEYATPKLFAAAMAIALLKSFAGN